MYEQGFTGMEHFGWGWGWGWGGMIFGPVMMVAVLALVIFLVMTLMRSTSPDRRRTGDGRDAEGLLRERFAAGEIDAEEFESRMRVLNGS